MVGRTIELDNRAMHVAELLTTERAALGMICLVAVGVRLWGAGAVPLSPGEAAQALPAALAVSGAEPDLAGVSPLLYTLQRFTFMLFGASDASARVWPALIAGLSPLLFYFLRDRLTRGGALMAALLWSTSPLAVWSSRLALGDSIVPPLALAFVAALNTVSARSQGRTSLAPFAAAASSSLLLISGGNAYSALLGLAAAALLLATDPRPLLARISAQRRTSLIAFAAFAGLGSTYFFLTPSGIAALAALAGEWVQGILPGTGEYAAWEMLARLTLSETLLLGFGIAGFIWSLRQRDRFGIGAAIVAGMAWLATIAGRGRHPVDLALVALALCLSAGPAAARVVRNARSWIADRDPWLLVCATSVLLFSALLAMPGIWNPSNPADWRSIFLGVFIATTLLFVVIWIAFGVWEGWDLVGRTLPVVLLLFAFAWHFGQMSALSYDRSAWRQPGVLHQVAATGLQDLRATLRILSALKGGGVDDAPIDLAWPQLAGDPALALLRWELRDFDNLRIAASIPPEPAPIVIAPVEDQSRLSNSYGGAEFPILSSWRPVALGDFNAVLRWILYRDARTPADEVRALLWFDRTN